MREWTVAFNRGRRALSRHRPAAAVRDFNVSLKTCPVADPKNLSRVLYYLGLALEHSGSPSLAVKSWVNARRLVRRGRMVKLFGRWVNDYGLRRCSSPAADDYQAFKSVQAGRYLGLRGTGKFGSPAERDVVYGVIADAFKVLAKAGILNGRSATDKLALFRRARLDFPHLHQETDYAQDCEPLVGNFRPGAGQTLRIRADDPCACGSGLPRRMCCGRLYSCREIESGSL